MIHTAFTALSSHDREGLNSKGNIMCQWDYLWPGVWIPINVYIGHEDGSFFFSKKKNFLINILIKNEATK